mgnify:CR=1 FL=1
MGISKSNDKYDQKYFDDSGLGDFLNDFINVANGDRNIANRELQRFEVEHTRCLHASTPPKGTVPPDPPDECDCYHSYNIIHKYIML